MIAELFYPKELKEVIADLRAEDDLNEEAIRYADKHVNVWVVLAVLTIFFVGSSAALDYKTTFFILLYILGPCFSVRLICQKYFSPYIFGEKRELTLIKVVTNYKYGDSFILLDEELGEEYKTHNILSLNEYRGILKPGDKVFCFLNDKNKGYCVPALDGPMQKLCLSKNRIKRNMKHDA